MQHIARILLISFYALILLKIPYVYAQCSALSEEKMQQAALWSGKPVFHNGSIHVKALKGLKVHQKTFITLFGVNSYTNVGTNLVTQ